MKIYNYDQNFIFTIETKANLDPLETQLQNKDIFLIPAFATTVKPPIYNIEKEFIKFIDGSWQIIEKPDLNKKVYYNVNKIILEFENITLVDQYILDNYQPATQAEIDIYLLDKAKQFKLAEIKAKRDEVLNKIESIIFDGKTYKINDNIRRLYQDKYNIGIFPINWRCIDDITWVSLINTKALQLLNSFIDFCENKNTTIYQKETTFIIALNSAQTVDDVNKIIVNY